jgi:uncharacterized membrane protein
VKPLQSKNAARWALVAIVLIAFFLRVSHLDTQSLWRDEVDTLEFSSEPLVTLVSKLDATGHNGPLYFLLLHPWRDLMGTTEFAIRFPSTVAGILVIPIAYLLARQFRFSRRTGLLLSLLLATAPYLVWYGQEAKMYTALMALVTLAFFAYLRALATSRIGWWLLFVAATSFSFYLHILAPLMLPVYVAVALLFWGQLERNWRAWLISMACLTLPYLPLVTWQLPMLLEGRDLGHPFYPFRQQIYLLLQLYAGGLVQYTGISAIVLLLFLLLAGFFMTGQRVAAENLSVAKRLVLGAWLAIPTLAIHLISLRMPVFEDRYLIYIIPAVYLVAALGIVLLRNHSRLLASFCLGLLLTFNLVGNWQQQRQPVKADFRLAANFIASQPQPPANIMIQIPYLEKTFNYYYPHRYNFVAGLWTNDGKSEDDVHAEMRRLTFNLTDLWLVVSEEQLWDQRQLMRTWLEQNGALVREAHFQRVDVYHYRLRPGNIESPGLSAK